MQSFYTTVKSIVVHVYVVFIQTLLDLGSSYVPGGPAQVEFSQVGIEYAYGKIRLYIIKVCSFEIKTPTHWT